MDQDYGNQSLMQQPSMEDVQRVEYDLTHLTQQVGHIGALQTMSVIPVVAGDSLEIDFASVFRLAPMRRNLLLDAQVDLFAFYVPHRHVYGDDWIDFIKSGVDEGVTLGTVTAHATHDTSCLGLYVQHGAAAPTWLFHGYMMIWNRYFKDPTDADGDKDLDYIADPDNGYNDTNFGIPCCHLKTLSTATINSSLTSADYRMALDSGEVNLLQLSQLAGRLKTEQARDWYGLRYRDIHKYTFNSDVVTDADQRPTLLARTTRALSGYDVDGTDDATLGSYSGKAQAICELTVPYRFMPEHGAVWIMALVRFPFVHARESHYLVRKAEPTYAQISGDPEVVRREPPVTVNFNEMFGLSTSVAMGVTPHSQWYRTQPNIVNQLYPTLDGHPFIDKTPSDREDHIYITHDLYDDIFMSTQFGHWVAQGSVGVIKRSFVPIPQTSMFAGTVG